MPTSPNVVLCTCDQLRAFEVGCYGNPVIRTPHVDRLAREGVRFEHAVTAYPVCMAARSSLLSGQHNRTCTGGVSNVGFPTWTGDCAMPEYPFPGRPHLPETTLPETLRSLGYHTAAIGKWHIHSWPSDVGFDEFVIPRVHHCHSGQSYSRNGGPEFVPAGWSVDFEGDEVERFLGDSRRPEQPFLLYYSISPPHCPVADAPERYLTMYDPAEVPIRANVDLAAPIANQDYWFRVYRWDFRHYGLRLPYTDHLPAGYGLRQLTAEYYGLTTWMDDAVGRMLAALDRTGLAEDTVVVFTSDHGDNLGSHGLVQKGGPNEESIRIPLVVRYPGRVPPQVASREVASLLDIAPTLIDMAGGAAPSHMHGQSLRPRLEGRPLGRDHAFVETSAGAAVRAPDRLVFTPYVAGSRTLADEPTEAYDLRADPYELRNLAGSAGQAAADASLSALLRAWDRATPWMADA